MDLTAPTSHLLHMLFNGYGWNPFGLYNVIMDKPASLHVKLKYISPIFQDFINTERI